MCKFDPKLISDHWNVQSPSYILHPLYCRAVFDTLLYLYKLLFVKQSTFCENQIAQELGKKQYRHIQPKKKNVWTACDSGFNEQVLE